jgi:hypothetical protein
VIRECENTTGYNIVVAILNTHVSHLGYVSESVAWDMSAFHEFVSIKAEMKNTVPIK